MSDGTALTYALENLKTIHDLTRRIEALEQLVGDGESEPETGGESSELETSTESGDWTCLWCGLILQYEPTMVCPNCGTDINCGSEVMPDDTVARHGDVTEAGGCTCRMFGLQEGARWQTDTCPVHGSPGQSDAANMPQKASSGDISEEPVAPNDLVERVRLAIHKEVSSYRWEFLGRHEKQNLDDAARAAIEEVAKAIDGARNEIYDGATDHRIRPFSHNTARGIAEVHHWLRSQL